MKLTVLGIALAITVAMAGAQESMGSNRTEHFPAKQLDSSEVAISAKSRTANPQTAAIELLKVPTHRISLRHRSGNAPAEQHPDLTDVFVVKSGTAVVLIGGEIVNPVGSNGELRGPSIRGAESFQASAGDLFNIPPNVAHQMILKPGETISFFTIKVNDPAAVAR